MKNLPQLLLFFCLSCFVYTGCEKSDSIIDEIEEPISKSGQVVFEKVFSQGIEHSVLGDSPNRDVAVYLPPGYKENTENRYPTIYFLHGSGGDHKIYLDSGMKATLDSLINIDKINPMIVVCPNANTVWFESFYANSTAGGNWEDFIVKDLVDFIDEKHRTLNKSDSRGITGFSSGAYGALKFAMKYPDVFGAVYSLNAGPVGLETWINKEQATFLKAASKSNFESIGSNGSIKVVFCAGLAFSPDTSTEKLIQLPINQDGVMVDSVFQKWLKHDVLEIAEDNLQNMLKLRGVAIEYGNSEAHYFSNASLISDLLTNNNFENTLYVNDGGHGDKLGEGIEKRMLPFFSDKLKIQ